jgi:hypothetical protein
MTFKKGCEEWKNRENPGRKKFSEELLKRALELNRDILAKELHNSKLVTMKEDGCTDEELSKFVMPVITKDKPIGDKDNPFVIKKEIDDNEVESILNAYVIKQRTKDSSIEKSI